YLPVDHGTRSPRRRTDNTTLLPDRSDWRPAGSAGDRSSDLRRPAGYDLARGLDGPYSRPASGPVDGHNHSRRRDRDGAAHSAHRRSGRNFPVFGGRHNSTNPADPDRARMALFHAERQSPDREYRRQRTYGDHPDDYRRQQ